jgi:hypothetical protein
MSNHETPFLMIGTPAYNGMVHVDFVHSLMSISAAGIPYTLITTGGESLITRARNGILARFHVTPACTHLLFLDGDIRISGESVRKLLSHDKDAIGAPVPLKTPPGRDRVFNIGGIVDAATQPVEVERIGTAAFLLSRNAVSALVADAIDHGRVYPATELARGLEDLPAQYDVFQVGVRDGQYLSEDFWVCRRLKELGIPVHADLSIRVKHYGMHDFSSG